MYRSPWGPKLRRPAWPTEIAGCCALLLTKPYRLSRLFRMLSVELVVVVLPAVEPVVVVDPLEVVGSVGAGAGVGTGSVVVGTWVALAPAAFRRE